VARSPLAAVSEGNDRLEQGSPTAAVEWYAQAIQADPLCVEAHLFSGIAFHQMGDAMAAMRALRSALFLDPGLWPAAFFLALSYETLGMAPDARREYRRVVETHQLPVELRSRGGLLRDLDAWKRDVVMLARKRAGPAKETRKRF
jgi:Tfp pilus assembly protein PilF